MRIKHRKDRTKLQKKRSQKKSNSWRARLRRGEITRDQIDELKKQRKEVSHGKES